MQTEPTKAEPPKRKRRWFQFSLRSLMIGVTLVAMPCAYVGWQAKIVRGRTTMAREVAEMGGTIFFVSEAIRPMHRLFLIRGALRLPPYPTVSQLRARLGDDFALAIVLPTSTPVDTVKRVEQIFPEADVAVKPAD